MKKTLTVNLGGIVFHIAEDAYQLLDDYLSNLRVHFSREEGTDEIMDDFETRISELLNDRIRLGFNVITIDHVEEVIKRMGKPEEIFTNEESKTEQNHFTEKNVEATAKVKKRLMRDPDDRILGGVASGLAIYMGCDIAVMRLILIALLILPFPVPFPVIITIYLILWMVVPVATTAADKLIMRGEMVNLENIGKTVTDNFEKVSNNMNEYIHSEKPRTALQKVADFIVSFVGILLKIGAVLLGVILIPIFLFVVVILLIVIFALLVGGIGTIFSGVPWVGDNIDMILNVPEYITVIGSVGGILLLGIPLITFIYMLCGKLMKLNPMPTGAKWTLIVIWFLSLIFCFISLYVVIGSNSFHITNIDWHSIVYNAMPPDIC